MTFHVLYVFFVLSLERRLILHANVTAHLHAVWAAQQVVEGVGENGAFTFFVPDRDAIFGRAFDHRVNNLGIRQLRIAPRSPWLREYARSYNSDRRHMSLSGDAAAGREVEPPDRGNVIVLPRVGGLHYRYTRRAA